MRRPVGLFVLWFLLIGSGVSTLAQSSRGTLTVTARVQTSVAWIQGPDGRWTLVVANVTDSAKTFSPNESKKAPSIAKHKKASPESKAVTNAKNSVFEGDSQ
jgi:hypothetical protein